MHKNSFTRRVKYAQRIVFARSDILHGGSILNDSKKKTVIKKTTDQGAKVTVKIKL